MPHSTLQRVLVVPFVLLVTALAGVIYWASHRSSENAGHEFSQRVVLAMLERVHEATERQLLGARVTLDAVAPSPVPSPADGTVHDLPFPADLGAIEERMWIATGIFPAVNNYVYYADPAGRFVGINRRDDRTELRLRQADSNDRHIYSVVAPGKRLERIRSDNYDPRTRPWYKTAIARQRASWSEVYTDFTTLEPTFTLSKPIYRQPGKELVGVVSTDLSLTQLTEFFRTLEVSKNGVAFVVERSGAIIATSSKDRPYRVERSALQRLFAAQSDSELLRQAYARVTEWERAGETFTMPVSREFESAALGTVQVGASLLRDPAGLEWITVVAVPRADFIGNVTSVLYQSLAIGLVAVFLVLILGFSLLQWVLRDIRKLTHAATDIGLGKPLQPLDIRRRDEIGLLARSLLEMERNLRTDRLTGMLNRDSLIAQVEFRRRNATSAVPLRFALLFIDLDLFKRINDEHGHDAGDRVLIEIARRIKGALRADDAVARFGGDEFVVYLHGLDTAEDVAAVRDKLAEAVSAPVEVKPGIEGRVEASIGWAFYPADGYDVDDLLKVADTRMFDSKKLRKRA